MNRYFPAQDGRDFRRKAFATLAERYRPVILDALELLHDIEFEFPALTKAHVEQLRPDLLFRQGLPFCVTEESYFTIDDSSAPVLAALFAGHTLALTHLDYHLDGSAPDPAATATAVKLDAATAASYAIRVVFAAGRMLDGVANGAALFQDVFDPISGFVVARMHEDWRERYARSHLSPAPTRLDEYLNSPSSRLLGSGYWELMIRGSFARHRAEPDPGLIEVAGVLRKLRQVVDEIADFDEDLRAGLVTTPLLFALADSHGSAAAATLSDAVRAAWAAVTEPVGDGDAAAEIAECRALVHDANGFERAFAFADDLWCEGVSSSTGKLGHRADGFLLLLDLKRAKMQDLRSAGWRNTSTERFFV